MKKSLLFILVAVALLPAFEAQAFKLKLKKDPKPRTDYTAWVASKDLPEETDGVRMFYPQTVGEDSITVIAGSIPVKGLTAEQVMLAAMVYAAENFDEEKQERFSSVSYPDKEFAVDLSTTMGANNKEATYSRLLTVKAGNGRLDFTVGDIKVRYRQKGIIPRTVDVETLHPGSDTRHEELILELSQVVSEYLGKMAKYASSRPDIKATHYDEMKDCSVVKGMNMDEVTIAKGPARDVRRSGERTRWIYDNEYVIIFTNGTVTKIVE